MRITYRTLAALILQMSDKQLDCDVTVEIPDEFDCECYPAELRIADRTHEGGLDDGHPVIFTNLSGEHFRRNDIDKLIVDIGINEKNDIL